MNADRRFVTEKPFTKQFGPEATCETRIQELSLVAALPELQQTPLPVKYWYI